MEVKFDDSESVQEILQVITPLIENIPCSLIVKDVAKRNDSLPRNDGSIIIFLTNFLLRLK